MDIAYYYNKGGRYGHVLNNLTQDGKRYGDEFVRKSNSRFRGEQRKDGPGLRR